MRFSAWGVNENIDGLIRQYLPKWTDLFVHSREELDTIAFELNMLPQNALSLNVRQK